MAVESLVLGGFGGGVIKTSLYTGDVFKVSELFGKKRDIGPALTEAIKVNACPAYCMWVLPLL